MSALPFVSVIIPAFNEERYLQGTFAALQALDYPRELLEVILVDNGSTDRTAAIAEAFGARVLHAAHVHVGTLRNLGARNAKGQILAFLDADCVPERDWLKTATALLGEQRCVTGADYFLPRPPHWIERVWYPPFPDGRRPVPYVNSGNLILFRDDFVAIGGFDERLSSGEDFEFGLRANKTVPVIADTSIRVVHQGNPKTLKGFFRRELWHGLGAVRTLKENPLDKPFWATLVFLGATLLQIIGVFQLLLAQGPAVFLFGTMLVVSTLAVGVLFRIRRFPNQRDYGALIVLLYVYLLGRGVALLRLINPAASKRRLR